MAKIMSTIGLAFCLAIIFSHAVAANQTKAKQGADSIPDSPLVMGLLHFAPALGDVHRNSKVIIKAMTLAKAQGVEWLLTPELALTGYHFEDEIGTAWISEGPDQMVNRIKAHAKKLEMGVLLSHLERPVDQPDSIFNTLFVIDAQGEIVARHRKINTIPQSEDWASKGTTASLVSLSGYRVGMLICADAWPSQHAKQLKEEGAQLILSSANWGPGIYGPGNTWEKRSQETGLPVVVNNRTGIDKTLDLREAKSVVSVKGERVFEYASEADALILLHWQRTKPTPALVRTKTILLEDTAMAVQ